MKSLIVLVTLLFAAGCGPTPHQLAMKRLDAAILQAFVTATPEQQEKALQLMLLQQGASAAQSDRQLQTIELFNQAVGNINGMYHQPVIPTYQTTTCKPGFGGVVTCTTY